MTVKILKTLIAMLAAFFMPTAFYGFGAKK